MSKGSGLIAVMMLLIGTGLRLAGSRGDLWVDEIYSVMLIQKTSHPLHIFTGLFESNNHHLHTLWMYFLRGFDNDWLYRLPSILSGIGTIGLMGWIARRLSGDAAQGRIASTAAMTLAALTFVLVLFGSEARGYSQSVLFTLLALAAILGGPCSAWNRRLAIFWIGVTGAMLSNLTSCLALVGVGLFSLSRILRENGTWPRRIAAMIGWHAPPAALLIGFYLLSVRHLQIGQSPGIGAWVILRRFFNSLIGLPAASPLILGIFLALILTIPGLLSLRQSRDDRRLLYLGGILIGPVVMLAIHPPQQLYERYFLGCVALWLLLLAEGAAWLWRRGRAGRAATLLIALLFMAGQIRLMIPLLEHGRGEYRSALRVMTALPGGKPIHFTTFLMRQAAVVDYFARRDPALERLKFSKGDSADPLPPEGFDWIIGTDNLSGAQPPAKVFDRMSNPYELAARFPTGAPDLSGEEWWLYRRCDSVPAPKP